LATSASCVTESWIQLIELYMGNLYYAALISTISSIVLSMDMAGRMYEEKLQQINEYMRNKKLPPEMRDNVRDFYQVRNLGAYTSECVYHHANLMNGCWSSCGTT